jgi:KDO2-lipid IV(A) lauroyltransferase
MRIGYFFSAYTSKLLQWKLKLFLSYILKYRQHVIIKNLEVTKIVKNEDIGTFSLEYYNQLATYITQIIYGYFAPKDDLYSKIMFENPCVLNQSISKGKNVFILASHLGNWEWSSILLPFYSSAKVVAVYKPLSNRALDQILIKCRSRFGLILSPMAQVIKILAKDKDQASIYIFVSDQRPAPGAKGEVLDFFSVKTSFNNGAFKLAQRYNADLYYQEISPRAKGEYSVKFTKMGEFHQAQTYANLLESSIRSYPTFWLWSHNRWK